MRDEDRPDYEDLGINPNSRHTGYECPKCGYEPTVRELDRGTCPRCFRARRAEAEVTRTLDAALPLPETTLVGVWTEGPIIVGVGYVEPGGALWSFPCPKRHHHLNDLLDKMGRPWPVTKNVLQGFVLDDGQFVTRETAEILARMTGQVTGEIRGSVLTSEDLW